MIQLTVTGPHTAKDQGKASQATKFIGQGSENSSTNQYRKDFGPLANCGSYERGDVVFCSAEGRRNGRLSIPLEELHLAVSALVEFRTDVSSDRARLYNVGERELEAFLLNKGYDEYSPGSWCHRADPVHTDGLNWWFYDELWINKLGPYTSRKEAADALSKYQP